MNQKEIHIHATRIMLRTRLWMGSILIAAGRASSCRSAPLYPFLLLLVIFLARLAASNCPLLGPEPGCPPWLCLAAVLAVLLANWPAHPAWADRMAARADRLDHLARPITLERVLAAFTAWRWRRFASSRRRTAPAQGRGAAMALTVWIIAYLGLLPSFLCPAFARLRGRVRPSGDAPACAAAGPRCAIFVPKVCDIGTYFTGRLLGRHPMTPVLSPKKTWEGLGRRLIRQPVAASVATQPPPAGPCSARRPGRGWPRLDRGPGGVLGDLAESLIKRDCRRRTPPRWCPASAACSTWSTRRLRRPGRVLLVSR